MPKDAVPEPADYNRYKLFPHYYQQSGGEEEMFLLLDLEAGKSWYYRGTFPAWKVLPDNGPAEVVAEK